MRSAIPLRSVLYMPGSNTRAMDKARELPADALVFDLEDAVAPEGKAGARSNVRARLDSGGYGERPVVVRCNALDSPWGLEDLETLADSPAARICLPKVSGPAVPEQALQVLYKSGRSDIRLWLMIETPGGVTEVEGIAGAPEVEALVMGTTDLAFELGIPPGGDRAGLQYALQRCVMAARGAGVAVLDGVCLALQDDTVLEAECVQGRALGFDGKTLIHPRQIAVANRIFGPDDEALRHAGRIIEAWEEATAAGSGVAVLDGRLVETMHIEEARALKSLAERIRRR